MGASPMPDAQTRLEDLLFPSYSDDGILDLLCGIALIFFGFTLFLGVAYLIGVSLIPLWHDLPDLLHGGRDYFLLDKE